jgi:hypothetical protein
MAVRLLCDAMLGSTARLFRVMGFDTAYVDDTKDDGAVLQTALDQGRVLVTRDFELAQRTRKAGGEAVLVRTLPVEQQVTIVLTHLGLDLDPARFYTRCTACNGILGPVPAKTVAGEVPPGVLERHSQFLRCPDCGKVYWEGTHVQSLDARLAAIVRAVRGDA